jgi:hypothetical protein
MLLATIVRLLRLRAALCTRLALEVDHVSWCEVHVRNIPLVNHLHVTAFGILLALKLKASGCFAVKALTAHTATSFRLANHAYLRKSIGLVS